jgi:hypothetical protein
VTRGALAQNILTHVDGVFYEGSQPFVLGWACERGNKASVDVKIHADAPQGPFVIAGRADTESDAGVINACQDRAGKHRLKLPLPSSMFVKGRERKLYAEAMPPQAAPPMLAGEYRHPTTHPWVFTTQTDLADLAQRSNVADSYSAKRFGQLAGQVARDLASRIDWSAVYTGCDAGLLQYVFSYEPQNGQVAQALRAALKLNPASAPPDGAAVVAARLALYAALAKAGATLPARAPSPDQAASLAKQILVAWGERGFRDGQGHFLTQPAQFCDAKGGHVEVAGVGLEVSRGILYSVQAQDLLMYRGALSAAEVAALNAFHSAVSELLLNSLNYDYDYHAWACDHYGNHSANILAGVLATARLVDNQKEFEAVLSGKDASIRVALPWVAYVDRAIYGQADLPNSCYFNSGPDGYASRPYFSTQVVAPGEIDDRFRNENAGQGIGYPMFTLERLLDAAELLRNAGFDPYGWRGTWRQSLETALEYYACYAKDAALNKVITAGNSGACANAAQYYGKIVSGVDRIVLVGAYRFPQDTAIAGIEGAAKVSSASGAFSLDAILFGKWRG